MITTLNIFLLIKKIKQINDDTNEWHFIGKIQSNKIKNIVEYFNWVQTISSTKHAEDGANESPYAFSKAKNTELIKNYGKWRALRG